MNIETNMEIEITINTDRMTRALEREIFEHDDVPYNWRNRISIRRVISEEQTSSVPVLRVLFTVEPEKKEDE